MTEGQYGSLYNGIITDKKKAAKEFKDMFKKPTIYSGRGRKS